MLTEEDEKKIGKIVADKVLEVVKEVLMPTFQIMDEKMDKGFEAINERFEVVNEKFEAINERFEVVNEKFEVVNEKFEALNEKVDTIDIKVDEIALNRKKDDKRIQRLEKSLTIS